MTETAINDENGQLLQGRVGRREGGWYPAYRSKDQRSVYRRCTWPSSLLLGAPSRLIAAGLVPVPQRVQCVNPWGSVRQNPMGGRLRGLWAEENPEEGRELCAEAPRILARLSQKDRIDPRVTDRKDVQGALTEPRVLPDSGGD